MLSHSSHLYDDLTVRENVRFAVRAAGADPGRIEGACDRLGLTGRVLRTSAVKLSAGQRRRVALAVLAARWPELWLLDEPHAGLDASARDTLDELIGEAAAGGVTVVIASHEAHQVEALATRAVTVAGGRVVGQRVIGAATGEAGRPPPADPPEPIDAAADPPEPADASPPTPSRARPVGSAGGPPEDVAHVA
jgi:ABC-type multidrug transport system ATPase subunit